MHFSSEVLPLLFLGLFIVIASTGWYAQFRKERNRSAFVRQVDNFVGMAIGGVTRKDKLDSARKALAKMRDGEEHPKYNLYYIDRALADGLNYWKIGTTAEEIEGFRNGGESQKIMARRLLASLRERPDWTSSIERVLQSGNLKPEDIGTSAEELRAIDRAFWLPIYRKELAEFRDAAEGKKNIAEPDKTYYSLMRVAGREDSKFTLADLGSSQEELDALLPRVWLACAAKWWKYANTELENSPRPYPESALSLMQKALLEAGKERADIGVTDEQIAELVRAAEEKRKNYVPPPPKPGEPTMDEILASIRKILKN